MSWERIGRRTAARHRPPDGRDAGRRRRMAGRPASFISPGQDSAISSNSFSAGAAGSVLNPADATSHAESRAEGRRGADVEGEILVTLAEVMHGTMRAISLQTFDPRTGKAETHSFQVRIPSGAMEGRRIRVPGKGEPGVGGAPAGDLYLRVRYAAHPDFRARGADLYHDVDLAPWEAVLGTTVVAPSFEGAIKVRIPPATNHGAQLRVRGHGLPRGRGGERGDLYVVTNIQVPPRLTEKEKTLWEELSRTSRFNPREQS